MNDLAIRRADKNDALELSKLYTQVWDEQKGKFPDELLKARQPDEKEMIKWLEKELYFIASHHNKTIGVIGCKIQYNTCKAIHMVIAKEYRGKGIGTLLLDMLEHYSKNSNLTKIWFDTSTRLIQAIEFYKKRGYREVGILHKHLWGEDIILFEKIL